MSLIGFVRDAGKRLFGMGKPETDALREHAESFGMRTEGVELSYDNGRVSASGTVADQAERERLVVALGNVEGVEAVEDGLTVAAEPEPESKFHTVVRGDTLGAIARTYYGKAGLYPKIFEANKPMLEHPDRIYPGQVLRIPPLPASAD